MPPTTDSAKIPAASLVMLGAGMIGFISFLLDFTWQVAWYLWLIPAACAVVLLVLRDKQVRERKRAREELNAQYGPIGDQSGIPDSGTRR